MELVVNNLQTGANKLDWAESINSDGLLSLHAIKYFI